MIDRVSTYPGRMKVTPEDGSGEYYATVEWADQPTQPGTALSKANLVTDENAQRFGLNGASATVNDMFTKLTEAAFVQGGIGTEPAYTEKTITYDSVTKGDRVPVVESSGVAWWRVGQVTDDYVYLVREVGLGSYYYATAVKVKVDGYTKTRHLYSEGPAWSALFDFKNTMLHPATSELVSEEYTQTTGYSGFSPEFTDTVNDPVFLPKYDMLKDESRSTSTEDFLYPCYDDYNDSNGIWTSDYTKWSYDSDDGSSNLVSAYCPAYKPAVNGWRQSYQDIITTSSDARLVLVPAIKIPKTVSYTLYEDVGGSYHLEQKYVPKTRILTDIDGLPVSIRFAEGTYTGTGVYGEDNPNSLTFEFAPKLFMIFRERNGRLAGSGNGSDIVAPICYVGSLSEEYTSGAICTYSGYSGSTNAWGYGKRSADGKTLTWYYAVTAAGQYNGLDTEYRYVAFGW